MLIAGEIEAVLPLEDAMALDNAKPISPDGKIGVDPGKREARHDAQVTTVLDQGRFGLIILGGSHDLSASMRRHAEKCEYLQVTTKRFKEIAE